MKILTHIKKLFSIFIFISISFTLFGQDCSLVSKKKDKKNNIETFSGIITSNNFYNLIILKQIQVKDSSADPKYCLNLIAATRVLFSDSILKTSGIMEVKLRDSSSIKYENVSFLNNPLGNCCTTIGCKVYLKKKQMEVLANNPIVSIVCLGLTTTFSSKKQKDQQKIVACLIDKR